MLVPELGEMALPQDGITKMCHSVRTVTASKSGKFLSLGKLKLSARDCAGVDDGPDTARVDRADPLLCACMHRLLHVPNLVPDRMNGVRAAQ